MAIMQKCCCWSLRSGSVLSAVYSLIYAAISLALAAYMLYIEDNVVASKNRIIFVSSAIVILVFVAILICSIILLFSIPREKHRLFVPYIIVMAIYVMIEIFMLIASLVQLIRTFTGMGFFYVLFNILCVALNITCILCVTSYYQVIRDSLDTTAPATNYA
ncbi:uncharacterized protein [Diadema setosum]|uniref:uncharacterized protein n=1 Tax=Diadema antillarum TaxID=105358 RepID=UPI003A8C07DF